MSPQAGWILQEAVVPRLRAVITRSVSCVGCEDVQELIQDATAIAAKMLHSVEAAGKTVTPGNIAYYAGRHLNSGRRSTGSSVVEVLASGTQLKGHARLSSLDEPAAPGEAGGESFTFHEVLSSSQEDPSQIAARNLDWQTLLTRLTKREKAVVNHLLEGRSVSEAALTLKISRSAMQGSKNRLVQSIRELMGADSLHEVLRRPGWRDDLSTARKPLACLLSAPKLTPGQLGRNSPPFRVISP